MRIWGMKKTCKIIWWDFSGTVHGKVFCRESGGKLRAIATAEGDPSAPFSSQLRDVNVALRHMQADAIVIYGYLPEIVCFELRMPNVDNAKIKSLLNFEVARRLPIAKDDLLVSFRADRSVASASQIPVRVFASRLKSLVKVFDALREAAVKFDAFCHPFLAVELKSGNESVEFPQTAPGLKLTRGEGGLLELQMNVGGERSDAAETVVAEYAMGKAFSKDKPYLSDISSDLRPHRFKNRRRLAILLGIFILLSAGFLGWREWQDQDRQIQSYQRATRKLNVRMDRESAAIADIEALGAFAEKMQGCIKEPPVIPVLESLTKQLPANTWITNFRTGNGKIAITISVSGDSSKLNNILSSLERYPLENLRKQQGADASETLYVTLGNGGLP